MMLGPENDVWAHLTDITIQLSAVMSVLSLMRSSLWCLLLLSLLLFGGTIMTRHRKASHEREVSISFSFTIWPQLLFHVAKGRKWKHNDVRLSLER